MSFSLVKVLSCAIFIAQQQNNKILSVLLKDYAKTQVTQTQFIFIVMLVLCYKDNNIFRNDMLYNVLEKYIYVFGNHLCRQLIFIDSEKIVIPPIKI